jgi:DNA polymerase-3 subunit beta
MFYEIVRKLPGAQIVLEGTGDRAVLAVRAGRSRLPCRRCRRATFPISPPAT